MFREKNLHAVAGALQYVVLLNTDFSDAIATARTGDFVYFDPPYMPASKTASFTSYTSGTFHTDQQIVLADVAQQLAERGIQVMISNSNTPFIRNLYRNFCQYEVQASRMINSKPANRGAITELVITSYQAS
jgi:DNA adenine methylase